jgi:hypothetical protein
MLIVATALCGERGPKQEKLAHHHQDERTAKDNKASLRLLSAKAAAKGDAGKDEAEDLSYWREEA